MLSPRHAWKPPARYRSVAALLFQHGDQALIATRMQARSGHYMPASLLDSQFETLEMPEREADVVTLAIDQPPAEMLRDALAALRMTV